MRFGRNMFSNLAGIGWLAAMQLVFTPVFIRCVGMEGYGLIGFFVTLQTLLQILDLGFAPTIARWLSRFTAGHEEAQRARDFARTLEIGSWTIAILAGALLSGFAGTVARLWFREATLPNAVLRSSLLLMACSLTALLPTAYYQSGLLGLGRAMEMNVLRALAATASTAGAAFALTRFASTAPVYFAVQAGVAFAHALVLRSVFWRSLAEPSGRRGRFRTGVLRNAWRFAAGMTGIAVCAAIAAQADRIILSRLVSLQSFGYYTVAWLLASGLAVVMVPARNTLFPQFSALVGDKSALRIAYHRGAQVVSVLLLPLASVVALFSWPILEAWTKNAAIANHAAPIATVLVVGMALNGLMHPAYSLQLASGSTRLALILSIAQIAFIVPVVTVLALRYGVRGAAFAWPAMNALYLAVGTAWTYRLLLPNASRDWILHDVGAPLMGAFIPAALARLLIPMPSSRLGTIVVIGLVLACSLAASALATGTTRTRLLQLARFRTAENL